MDQSESRETVTPWSCWMVLVHAFTNFLTNIKLGKQLALVVIKTRCYS